MVHRLWLFKLETKSLSSDVILCRAKFQKIRRKNVGFSKKRAFLSKVSRSAPRGCIKRARRTHRAVSPRRARGHFSCKRSRQNSESWTVWDFCHARARRLNLSLLPTPYVLNYNKKLPHASFKKRKFILQDKFDKN